MTVLVGANNAGKSTVLRQINEKLNYGAGHTTLGVPQVVTSQTIHRSVLGKNLLQWLHENAKFVEGTYGTESIFVKNGRHFSHSVVANMDLQHLDSLNDLYSEFVFFADASSRLQLPLASGLRGYPSEPPSSPMHHFQDDRKLFGQLQDLSRRVFDTDLTLDDFGSAISIRVGSVSSPLPRRDEPLGSFGDELMRLPMLDTQGDGMRSFFGLIVPLLAAPPKIILVDEPEAFLHPPQARALGRILADIAHEKSVQVIAASHDKDFIAGLLSSQSPVSVVRLVRTRRSTRVATLSASRLQEVWDDRNLRYTNILNGLFSKLVVVCESEQDCRFYEAAFDRYAEKYRSSPTVPTIPVSDILFVPSGGKGGFASLHTVLRDLSVPTATIADIDVFEEDAVLKPISDHAGLDWDKVSKQLRILRSALPGGNLNSAKKYGERVFKVDSLAAFNELVSTFDAAGMMALRVGELEGFAPAFAKDRAWLRSALEQGADASTEAEAVVSRVLGFYFTRPAA
ncbi:ATP-dependent nuclease [Agreia bicolorata]|uniref:ATP-dependent nuclease n=1 Tax=Agreia bicolorata TaxID=110935 RepID=UPI001590F047|nr:ATP-binding protein [Agreia bicolorata]